MKPFVVLMACPDQPGIVARITGVLFDAGCNIVALEQHVEDGRLFYMRIVADGSLAKVEQPLAQLAKQLGAEITLRDKAIRRRAAILVSSEWACADELLEKQRIGDLAMDTAVVIGNHPELRRLEVAHGIRFEYVPTEAKIGGAHEERMKEILDAAEVDLVILARYMKILSPEFVSRYEGRMINIHHGFLPAFKGAHPYRQAWERGVKIIGATAHFVTAGLDEGPIIAQDVTSVTHEHSVAAMVATGRDIEKRVLAEAVKAYLEDRILLTGARTIVFRQTD
jgi:formyltetrahydrofolate deformylase